MKSKHLLSKALVFVLMLSVNMLQPLTNSNGWSVNGRDCRLCTLCALCLVSACTEGCDQLVFLYWIFCWFFYQQNRFPSTINIIVLEELRIKQTKFQSVSPRVAIISVLPETRANVSSHWYFALFVFNFIYLFLLISTNAAFENVKLWAPLSARVFAKQFCARGNFKLWYKRPCSRQPYHSNKTIRQCTNFRVNSFLLLT